MMDITFFQFFVALLVSLAAWCVFLWAIRTGQFRDVEDIKYQVWPSAGEPPGGPGREGSPSVSEAPEPTDSR
jgi:cbb3-type cytochrome oxidase maturation protein